MRGHVRMCAAMCVCAQPCAHVRAQKLTRGTRRLSSGLQIKISRNTQRNTQPRRVVSAMSHEFAHSTPSPDLSVFIPPSSHPVLHPPCLPLTSRIFYFVICHNALAHGPRHSTARGHEARRSSRTRSEPVITHTHPPQR